MRFSHWMLRLTPVLLVILLVLLFSYFNLYRFFSLSSIQHYHGVMLFWVTAHYGLSLLIFSLTAMLIISTSFPFPTFFSILSGYLFGPWIGSGLSCLSNTIASILMFYMFRVTLSLFPTSHRFDKGKHLANRLRQNDFHYLLFLRILPISSFWLTNLAAALVNVRLRSLLFATLLGTIPSTFIYAWSGNAFRLLLNRGHAISMHLLFQADIFWPLLGLAFLALLPVIIKSVKLPTSLKTDE